jgi:ABC-type nitrate/sulfonate/bicarbonate transport system substrate-binding protein
MPRLFSRRPPSGAVWLSIVALAVSATCAPASTPATGSPAAPRPGDAPSGSSAASVPPGGSAPTANATLGTIRLALPTVDLNYMLPIAVAESQGYLREEGVEAPWTAMNSTASVPATLNGEIDLSPASSAIVAAAQGAPLRALYFPYNTSTFQFNVDPQRIREPRDLTGQAIGIASVGNAQDVATKLIVRSLGVDPLAVQYLPLGGESNRVTALLTGQIVAAANNPNVAAELRRQGYPVIANSYSVMPIPWSGYGGHTSFVRDQATTLRGWLRAMIRAQQFAHQFPDAAADIAGRALDMDPDIARESVAALLEVMYEADPGGWTEASMIEHIKMIRETNPELREPPLDDVADVGPLREAQRSLGIQCRGGYKC